MSSSAVHGHSCSSQVFGLTCLGGWAKYVWLCFKVLQSLACIALVEYHRFNFFLSHCVFLNLHTLKPLST